MSRAEDLDHFYELLERLDKRVGGPRRLADCTGHMDWPKRGVYFFFATDESRNEGSYPRLTRIGTHAVSIGSGTSMWNRLRTHRGANSGTYEDGGNHRGSVFRKRVGEAIIERDGLSAEYPEWGEGSSAGRDLRLAELPLERRVSEYIRALPFLWVAIDDEPGPDSARAYIERNAIALVSNDGKPPLDPRRDSWLGHNSHSDAIRSAGLWNVDHVDEQYDPGFLSEFAAFVAQTEPL